MNVHQLRELGPTHRNLFRGEGVQALRTEFLHAEAGHGGGVEQGAFHVLKGDIIRLRQVANEAAGEGVARAGGIHHVCQGKGRGEEDFVVLAKEQGAVLPFLDDQGLGAQGADFLGRLHQIQLPGEQARLLVVDG